MPRRTAERFFPCSGALHDAERSRITIEMPGIAPMANKPIAVRCYPEIEFGGFSKIDGTVAFYTRAQALAADASEVLLVGCGRGSFLEDNCQTRRDLQSFQHEGRHVMGIDVDPAAAENRSLDEFRLMEDPNKWPVDSGSVDFVCSDYVLEHVENPDSFFAELGRVLKPGGTACFRTPNRWSYISIAAQLIPNKLHASVVGRVQNARKEEDVFPTVYRCNTPGSIRKQLRRTKFDVCVLRHEGEPSYLDFHPLPTKS